MRWPSTEPDTPQIMSKREPLTFFHPLEWGRMRSMHASHPQYILVHSWFKHLSTSTWSNGSPKRWQKKDDNSIYYMPDTWPVCPHWIVTTTQGGSWRWRIPILQLRKSEAQSAKGMSKIMQPVKWQRQQLIPDVHQGCVHSEVPQKASPEKRQRWPQEPLLSQPDLDEEWQLHTPSPWACLLFCSGTSVTVPCALTCPYDFFCSKWLFLDLC